MGKLTIEYVKSKIKDINENIEILENEYINNATKMKCLCKIHNHEFYTAWAQLQANHGCPMCGGSMPLTMEIVKERLSKINDNIEILDEEYVNLKHKMNMRCKIDGFKWTAHAGNLLHNNRGCPRCAKNERIDTKRARERLIEETSNIEFGEFEYKNHFTKIPCTCKIDGHKWSPIFNALLRGSGCPVCSNKAVMVKRNDVATSSPHLVKYFKHKADAEKYTEGSNKKVEMICPDCGSERLLSINQLFRQGFPCKICGDGISRNNKLMISLFKQLGVHLETEYKFKPNRFSYDGMFEHNGVKYLVEMHGAQHYKENGRGRKLEQEIQNDIMKKDFANKNNYVYIEVDCSKFDYDFIKSSVLSSIGEILDLSKINWGECFQLSYKSMVAIACEMRRLSGNKKTTTEIAKEMCLDKKTILKYLKMGNKLGLCIYEPKYEAEKIRLENSVKASEKKQKDVVQLSVDWEFISNFKSLNHASREFGTSAGNICNCCKGKRDFVKGFRWMYLEDYMRSDFVGNN